ncbi:hypothetical protein HGRIS_014447 [Hohenbuehelia grisea]|uniref:lytic cellulose monooxygenase (C4-dehydrogenating) n=1 Tax=Hohenbuehelia grisea TaxID=104357 RepID=A0ABR3JVQ2_9AGAR
MLFKLPLLTCAFALPSLVAAHGFVRSVTINGKAYQGNVPNAFAKASGIRQINDVGPVKGAGNIAINCGQNAVIATQSLSANPGDKIEFDWAGGDGSNWPHNTGPMLTYMASCGSVSCDKFNAINAKWFKIQQVGRKTDGSGQWAQQDLMNGAKAVVNLPSNLAPGNYLIRHEIIALHLATSFGGAEFYPSCAQLKVGGSGSGSPNANELVSLPGAYSDNDPGIFDMDTFNPSAKYTFPGPPIASFVTSGADKASFNVVAPGAAPASDSGAVAPAPVGSQAGDEEPCDDMDEETRPVDAAHPTRRSRIMRDLEVEIAQ